MDTTTQIDPRPADAEPLIDEITRYLAVVDAFRAAGCDPRWEGES
jgi:hypothetical protein